MTLTLASQAFFWNASTAHCPVTALQLRSHHHQRLRVMRSLQALAALVLPRTESSHRFRYICKCSMLIDLTWFASAICTTSHLSGRRRRVAPMIRRSWQYFHRCGWDGALAQCHDQDAWSIITLHTSIMTVNIAYDAWGIWILLGWQPPIFLLAGGTMLGTDSPGIVTATPNTS